MWERESVCAKELLVWFTRSQALLAVAVLSSSGDRQLWDSLPPFYVLLLSLSPSWHMRERKYGKAREDFNNLENGKRKQLWKGLLWIVWSAWWWWWIMSNFLFRPILVTHKNKITYHTSYFYYFLNHANFNVYFAIQTYS